MKEKERSTQKSFDGSASQTERIILFESTRRVISSQEGNLRQEGGMWKRHSSCK